MNMKSHVATLDHAQTAVLETNKTGGARAP